MGLTPICRWLWCDLKLLLTYRLARVAIHLAIGMTKSLVLFPWLDVEGRNRRIRAWSRQLLAICNVTVEASASHAAALEHCLVVANHVSWLDIFVIDAVHPCRFVAKAEIRAWPILGWLAARAGTIFISRGNKRDLRKIFQGLVDKLQRRRTYRRFSRKGPRPRRAICCRFTPICSKRRSTRKRRCSRLPCRMSMRPACRTIPSTLSAR